MFKKSKNNFISEIINIFRNKFANIIIINLIKIDIINKIFERILINKMLINNETQISKNAFNYKMININ